MSAVNTSLRGKRKAPNHHHRLSCPSSSNSSSDESPPHKKLALSLNRLSLSSTPNIDPDPPDIEMRQRKSYEKDAFTTVIESLSTTTSDDEEVDPGVDSDAPFPRDEAHVTILSEIEKRLTKFPGKLIAPTSAPDNALVLYRSPESMGLPKLERQKQEELKEETRKRILETRRRMRLEEAGRGELDGYEADYEDPDYMSPKRHVVNGHAVVEDEEEGDLMDLD